MTVFAGRSVMLSLAAALSLTLVSCGESKVSQCRKLIEVANGAVTQVQEVTQNANPEDVNAMLQIADTADQATQDMQALELKDEALQGYQQRFITMYTDTSQSTRQLVEAVNNKDSQAADTAYQSLQTATNQEAPLVTEVNEYCQSS